LALPSLRFEHIKIPHFCGIVKSGGADRSPGKTIISLVNEIYLSMIKPIPEKAPFLA